MLTGELRAKIDSIWDVFWSGGISNPLTVVEQLTYLLFIKRLDEIQINRELRAKTEGKTLRSEDAVFPQAQDNLRWSHFKDMEAADMFENMVDKVFPFIKNLGGDGNGSYSRFMKDAVFMIPTPQFLERVVSKLNDLPMEKMDLKGDIFEYVLSKIASAGQNGQFRTPRHIIRLMVELAKPHPNDIICDPASGTSGFLIGAAEYLKETCREIFRDKKSREHFNNHMFYGRDFDVTMLRIGAMNLVLHGIENPNLSGKDSLSEAIAEDRGRYSLVLANPPFKGSLDFLNVANDLLKQVRTKKTELLFLALFIALLRTGGRCACIVPDGVLFGSSKAHKDTRKAIVDEQQLQAVISMPSGVFKPYAGVSTAILFFTKTGSGGTEKVWFYDMQADGFSLDDKRTPLDLSKHENNNIPDIISRWNNLSQEEKRKRTEQSFLVPVEEIRENGYDLSINRYKELVYEEVSYRPPQEIIAELKTLETEITKGLTELHGMVL